MSAEVHRIDGSPGVGKSTRLLKLTERERDRGTALDELYLCTFARSGREESADALAEVFPDADREDVVRRAKTFHGVACSAAIRGGIIEDPHVQIIQRTGRGDEMPYREFAEAQGLGYASENRSTLQRLNEGENLQREGNRLFALNDWLKLSLKGPQDAASAPTRPSLRTDKTAELLDAWAEYKRRGGPGRGSADALALYEHADYIDRVIRGGLDPGARVLFIDEFQDLAPQEYRLFETWRDSGAVDRIYISGDVNQSIYSFRQGTPLFFAETPTTTEESLTASWRCPPPVASVAAGILATGPGTSDPGFTSRKSAEAGAAEVVSLDRTTDDLGAFVRRAQAADRHATPPGDPSVFLLARTNYKAHALSSTLREAGVPHEWLGSRTGTWDETAQQLLAALRGIRAGRSIHRDAASALAKAAPNSSSRRKEFGRAHGDVYYPGQVRAGFGDASPGEIIDRLNVPEYRADALRSAVETDIPPADVRVGTIHSAKGLEAPAVLLFDTYTKRLDREYSRDESTAAEEHRLFFVGASRASESLYVARDTFDGHTFPGFTGGVPGIDRLGSEVAV
jgi:superfamily I DNA/RNA helicase